MAIFDPALQDAFVRRRKKILGETEETQVRENIGQALAGAGTPAVQATIRSGDESLARQSQTQRAVAGFNAARGGFLGQGVALQNQAATEDNIARNLAEKLRGDAQLVGDQQMGATQTALSQLNRQEDAADNDTLQWWQAGAEASELNPVLARKRDEMLMERLGFQYTPAEKEELLKYTDEITQSALRKSIEANTAQASAASLADADVEKATPEQLATWAKSSKAISELGRNPGVHTVETMTDLLSEKVRPGEVILYNRRLYRVGESARSQDGRTAPRPAIDLATGQEVALGAEELQMLKDAVERTKVGLI